MFEACSLVTNLEMLSGIEAPIAQAFFPSSEIPFDFNEGSSGVFKAPSDLLLGSQRVAMGGGGITIPV